MILTLTCFFSITGKVSIKMDEEGEFSSVSVYVRFQRRYVFYLLTLYIPSTLLIIIAYATFFFNPQDFNSRIVVALTSLLVLSSLYTQVCCFPYSYSYIEVGYIDHLHWQSYSRSTIATSEQYVIYVYNYTSIHK